jgi:hypothetical protein
LVIKKKSQPIQSVMYAKMKLIQPDYQGFPRHLP